MEIFEQIVLMAKALSSALLMTLLLLVLYIIIAYAILKCVHIIKVIKIWELIEEILKTLQNHTKSFSSSLGPSQTQGQTPSRLRNTNTENIEEIVPRTRNNINNANNEIILRELAKSEMAPPPSYEETKKENCPASMNSCSSLPTYEESLTFV
jgi:cytoskeletal protein RodZ